MKESKRNKGRNQIENLKTQRKKQYAKCALALAIAIIAIAVKFFLGMTGIIDTNNAFFTNGLIVILIGLCIFAGTASLDASKISKEIAYLSQKYDLRSND